MKTGSCMYGQCLCPKAHTLTLTKHTLTLATHTHAHMRRVDELQPAAWGPVGALGGVADEPSIDGSNFDDSDWEDGMAAPSQKK
eukprot:1161724-Pelagomonas_calceolata.AAC.13